MSNEKVLREIIKQSGIRLLEHNLVQGTWGNTSAKLNDTSMICTPSGMDYIRLTTDDLSVVNIENPKEWIGSRKPTSERKIHAAVYRSCKEAGAVIHSHPTYCSVLAAARVSLPIAENLRSLIGGDEVKVGGYGLPGTKKLTKNTMEGLGGRKAVLMANHGVICWGRDMDEAFDVLKILEEESRLFIEKKVMEKAKAKTFSREQLYEIFENYVKKA